MFSAAFRSRPRTRPHATFGQRTGFLVLTVGAAHKLPPAKTRSPSASSTRPTSTRYLAREPGHRNRVPLRLRYRAGLRVSEVARLSWRDLHTRDDGGQVTVFGKGGMTRTVLLPADVWRDLVSLRGDASLEDPVFRSRRGRHLDPSANFRIVRCAAERAEFDAGSKVSPTGCATRTPPTPSNVAHRSNWCRPRSDTHRSPLPTVRHAIRQAEDHEGRPRQCSEQI